MLKCNSLLGNWQNRPVIVTVWQCEKELRNSSIILLTFSSAKMSHAQKYFNAITKPEHLLCSHARYLSAFGEGT